MTFRQTRLENGLEIIGEELAGVQSAAVAFFVAHGAVDDDPASAGLAHLTESTLFRGTANRSSRDITEQLDRLGVSHSSSTGLEMTLVSGMMLGNHLIESLDIFVDVLRRPAFDPDELEAVRSLQLQEIGQRNDQPAQVAMDSGRMLFFRDHPLGHDSLGTVVSVESLRRDQVVESWSKWFRPGSMVVAVAGNFDWDDVVEKLTTLTAGWEGSADRLSTGAPGVQTFQEVLQSPGAQEHLCFCFPGVDYSDPRYYAVNLMATVLGSGMNSRLFMEVREKRGLAYSVGARFDAMSAAGLLRIYAGTQPERARESVEVIREELQKLERLGLTDEELALGKTRLKSRVILSSESTGSRVMRLGRDWFYEQRFRPLHESREAIDAVTLDQVMDYLAQARITETLGMVAFGPLTAVDLGLEQAHVAGERGS